MEEILLPSLEESGEAIKPTSTIDQEFRELGIFAGALFIIIALATIVGLIMVLGSLQA